MSDVELAREMIDPDLPGYAVATQSGSEIEGYFLNRYFESDFSGTQKPTFMTADDGAIDVSQQLSVKGKNYKIKDDHPDGVGMILFILEAI